MKRLAGMQPYFFPYLGYWQLIAAVDCFVLFDEAQYIKQGWVNRNRILKPGGGWQYIQVPVARHSQTTAIRDVQIAPESSWKIKIINQLAHYKTKATHFWETMEIVESTLLSGDEKTIGALNCRIVRQICEALSIRSEIITSSDYKFDYSAVTKPSDYALVHAQRLGATELVNPINGITLLSEENELGHNGIALSALLPPTVIYSQFGASFETSLSIIDVMMFNGIAGTSRLLSARTIIPAAHPVESARNGSTHE